MCLHGVWRGEGEAAVDSALGLESAVVPPAGRTQRASIPHKAMIVKAHRGHMQCPRAARPMRSDRSAVRDAGP